MRTFCCDLINVPCEPLQTLDERATVALKIMLSRLNYSYKESKSGRLRKKKKDFCLQFFGSIFSFHLSLENQQKFKIQKLYLEL